MIDWVSNVLVRLGNGYDNGALPLQREIIELFVPVEYAAYICDGFEFAMLEDAVANASASGA